jgi:carboxyl-terminal processing protease
VTQKRPSFILTFIVVLVALGSWPGRADEPPPFPDGEKAFKRARDLIKEQYVDDKMGDDRLWQSATNGLLYGLSDGNRYNQLLSPGDLAALQGDFTGEFVGIGVEIDFEASSGMVIVEAVIDGSAAQKAGVHVGDRILRIDDRSLKGLDLMGVGRLIRGKRGSTVTIALLRDAQVVTKTMARMPITITAVDRMELAGGVALLAIRSFNEKTPGLVAAALQKVKAAGEKAMVIDLRDNQGGLFEKMLECAGMFLPRGSLVVTMLGRGGKSEELHTTAEPLIGRMPTVVLINGDSASGAEILAAALKSADGARLVGSKTRGKWSVQRVEELGNGWAIKLTTALLRSPAGQMLDGKGLEPDLQVDMKDHLSRDRDPERRVAADCQLRAGVHLLQMTR